ncbi:CpaE family protein [Siminovitchia sediminis]|uniref:CpaE family protein n=1 Tax=Siminovitchia sediminis TaxID=1274353 RepID=A0ABW4KN07_9BACI
MNEGTEGMRTIAVCHAAGGTGATFLTVNLAIAFAKRQIETAILDADFQFGDVALALDVKPVFTIKDYVEGKDSDKLPRYCLRHPSGIRMLAAPSRPEFADLVTAKVLDDTLSRLQSMSEVVLIDTPAGLHNTTLQVAEQADEILVVAAPGMAVLKNTKLYIETLEALGMKEKIKLVINKYSSSSLIPLKECPELCSKNHAYFLPYEKKLALPSVDNGIPLLESHPKLEFSQKVERMSHDLVKIEAVNVKKPLKKRWLPAFGK